jgi:uncharacterized protein (TIGR03067 family)
MKLLRVLSCVAAGAVLAIGLGLASRAADDASGDTKKDMDKFQGEWMVASSERNGEKVPEDEVKSLRRTVKGDEFTVTRDGETLIKGKFKLDATKKPKTIDIALEMGGDPVLGIYEIDVDSYKVCYTQPGQERPKEFSSKEATLATWKRVKK